ncbi:MAG: nuclear transport factor 2 family protein, partial [Acidobacteriaceae bacterium]|nr:nuclear transport factor 2 family protein [Acidobacteriaceae bacterium]
DATIVRPSGVLETKAQRLAAIRSGELRFESFSYDEVGNIRQYGNTAAVTARATVRGQNRGQAINEQTRVTLTLVRTRGRWQIVATQGTRIAEQQQ